jgi:hypothetical protein
MGLPDCETADISGSFWIFFMRELIDSEWYNIMERWGQNAWKRGRVGGQDVIAYVVRVDAHTYTQDGFRGESMLTVMDQYVGWKRFRGIEWRWGC